MRVRTLPVAVLLLLSASLVRAQGDPPLHRLQLAAGLGFLGGAPLGDADARLRSTTSPEGFRVFTTSTRLSGATAVDLRAAVDLTRRYGLEAHTLWGHPELRASVTGDVEGAPPVMAVERLDHYLIDGGVVIKLNEFRLKGWLPLAAVGAGYLRQLHEGLTVIDEGRVFYVGGGARRVLVSRARGLLRGLGARGDVRLNVLSGGITVDGDRRRQVSVSGSAFVLF